MKTAISVPDLVFAQVEVKVETLGVSRSQFYTTAAEHYLRELAQRDLTEQINEAVELETAASARETSQFVAAGVASSSARLGAEPW